MTHCLRILARYSGWKSKVYRSASSSLNWFNESQNVGVTSDAPDDDRSDGVPGESRARPSDGAISRNRHF
jgi:hypothetical protein